MIPAWLRAKNATRAPAFRDDADAITRTSSPGCAFCEALADAVDVSIELGRPLGLVELEAIAREWGECSCLTL